MYGRKHSDETIKIRQKAYERPKMRWCVEPSGKAHLVRADGDIPASGNGADSMTNTAHLTKPLISKGKII